MSICFRKPVAKLENAIIENPTSVSEKIAALCSEVACESTHTVFLCILGIGFQEPLKMKTASQGSGTRLLQIFMYFGSQDPGTDELCSGKGKGHRT